MLNMDIDLNELDYMIDECLQSNKPKLDDEFAKDVSEFDTLNDLKTSIKEKRQASNDDRAKHETETAAVEEVAKNTEIDIPSGMIDNEVETMIRDMDQQLSYQGINLEQYLKIMNKRGSLSNSGCDQKF